MSPQSRYGVIAMPCDCLITLGTHSLLQCYNTCFVVFKTQIYECISTLVAKAYI